MKLLQAVGRMRQEVKNEIPEKEIAVEFMKLDLASFQSTKDFIRAFKDKNLPLHILINNAGLAWPPFSQCMACIFTTLHVIIMAQEKLMMDLNLNFK